MRQSLLLDLEEIQGDVLVGLPKRVENFIFFKITHPALFMKSMKQNGLFRVTSAQRVNNQKVILQRRKKLGQRTIEPFWGLNVGFTKNGMTELIGAERLTLDPSFKRGADHRDTIELGREFPLG